MNLLEIGQIKQFREDLEDETIDLESLSLIDEAFQELVDSGADLRDLPENASASDKLDEIAAAIPDLAYIMYDYVDQNFGDADDPCYYLTPFAFHILERQDDTEHINQVRESVHGTDSN